jgi:hypothetical protein
MNDSDSPSRELPPEDWQAAREWLWRHSSQPNGDPWDGDPEHLDWAARDLLTALARRHVRAVPARRRRRTAPCAEATLSVAVRLAPEARRGAGSRGGRPDTQ